MRIDNTKKAQLISLMRNTLVFQSSQSCKCKRLLTGYQDGKIFMALFLNYHTRTPSLKQSVIFHIKRKDGKII